MSVPKYAFYTFGRTPSPPRAIFTVFQTPSIIIKGYSKSAAFSDMRGTYSVTPDHQLSYDSRGRGVANNPLFRGITYADRSNGARAQAGVEALQEGRPRRAVHLRHPRRPKKSEGLKALAHEISA